MKNGTESSDVFHVKSLEAEVVECGKRRIQETIAQMPVVQVMRKKLAWDHHIVGLRIGACLHVTAETAALVVALREAGAHVALCASNPLSTQDDVAAALAAMHEVSVFAVRGETQEDYYKSLESVVKSEPRVLIDDGADLITLFHKAHAAALPKLIGACEETTSGVNRLRRMEKSGDLKIPVVAVNSSRIKHLFDNRYGTGQSTLDAIMRASHGLVAGTVFVVGGYGWCGKGVAMRARGMGARVVVTEVDPIKAVEAVLDGFEVLPMIEAARIGDIFVTVTGGKHVIRPPHFQLMKQDAILANAGHFDIEIDVAHLNRHWKKTNLAPDVDEYFKYGKRLRLLAEGRLVNLALAGGHPPQVMDLSFAGQMAAVAWLISEKRKSGVHVLPDEIDRQIAEEKLAAMGVNIDKLTKSQQEYNDNWEKGT